MATPPIIAASPNLPAIARSTIPTNGTVMVASMLGTAILNTFLFIDPFTTKLIFCIFPPLPTFPNKTHIFLPKYLRSPTLPLRHSLVHGYAYMGQTCNCPQP